MNYRSKLLLVLIVLAILGAVYWRYQEVVRERDFILFDQVECDPAEEACFKWDCDISAPDCDPSPYKKIRKSAQYISMCANYHEGACPALSCAPGEEQCEVTYCSLDTLEDEEVCTTPEDADQAEESEDMSTPE